MRHFLIAAVACSLFGLPVYAEEKHHQGEKAAAQAEGPMTEGEVRKVDKDAKKITIKHGPLVKLEMPAMTMVFQVKDPAMLDKVKAGDKVRFDAEKIGGAFTLTQIEPVK
jgi:Cu(I)/Ag(I) efflux system protein CusF